MSIQAMKQALEVLEKHLYFKDEPAITALRAAIEAAEKVEPVAEIRMDMGLVRLPAGYGLPAGTELYTTPQPAIPAGWQLVPAEPTPEMISGFSEPDSDAAITLALTYKAMLAAAPKPEEMK